MSAGVASPITPVEEFNPQYLLFGDIAPGWRLTQLLLLTVEEEQGYYIVSDDVFVVYGDGDTLEAAHQDYVASLLDYYRLVEASANTRIEDRPVLLRLQEYLVPV